MRRANRPVTDNDGHANLSLESVDYREVEDVRALKKGLAPDECRYWAYDLVFTCDGITGPFRIKERCGSVVNDQPVETKYRGKEKIYNKLTTLLMSTGLVDESDLTTADTEVLHKGLLGLGGTQYKGGVVKVDGFYRVNIAELSPA